jgi:hypothetical protein
MKTRAWDFEPPKRPKSARPANRKVQIASGISITGPAMPSSGISIYPGADSQLTVRDDLCIEGDLHVSGDIYVRGKKL